MTSRERVLVILFLGAVVLLGGGGLCHLCFLKPYSALRTRLQVAQKEIDAKKAEIKSEEDEISHAEKLDPRLTRWDTYSLPDTTNRDPEKLQRHVSDERVKYESYLFELLKEAGFQGISTASKEADARSVAQFANKLPVYTRLTYTVEAKASFNSVVKMFKAFYGAEKLHQVREFKIRKPLLANANRGTNPGGPGAPGGADGQGGPDRSLLDVTMNVEALIVTGAKPREARKAEDKPRPVVPQRPSRDPDPLGLDAEEAEEQAITTPVTTGAVSILAPHRHYEDMLEKNIYTGQGVDGRLTENPRDVLDAVHLVMMERKLNPEAGWFDPPKLWWAEFRNQGEKDKSYKCTPDKADDSGFTIKDRWTKTVIKGAVVDANIRGVVIKVEGRYHKMYLGDSFDDVMNPPLAEDGKIPLDSEREPLDKYTRGSWTGVPARDPEEPSEILRVVTLAKTTDTGRRWEVDFADPVRKRDYTCTPDSSIRNAFAIKDRKSVVVLSGTVVDANTLGAVIKVDELFYKIRIGQSFSEAIKAPLKEYTRGDWKAPPADGEAKKDRPDGKKADKGN
jgi:hypothetical protein